MTRMAPRTLSITAAHGLKFVLATALLTTLVIIASLGVTIAPLTPAGNVVVGLSGTLLTTAFAMMAWLARTITA